MSGLLGTAVTTRGGRRDNREFVMTAVKTWPTPLLIMVAAVLFLTGCSTGEQAGPSSDRSLGPVFQPRPPGVSGRQLYISSDLQSTRWQRAHGAAWLSPLTRVPQARWINSERDLPSLRRAARDAARQERLLTIVAYAIPDRGCSDFKQGAPDAASYERFVGGLVHSLGRVRALVVLEPDAIAADCFTSERGRLLGYAVGRLSAAHQYVYIDAGHASWRPSGLMAGRLLQSGITEAAGFALNVAARDSTRASFAYGEELSDLVGDRPYIIDTSRNGLGAPPEVPGRDAWCNPPRQALGEAPSTTARGHNVARLWIKNPGESDGQGARCGGETAYAGLFSARQARDLLLHTSWLGRAARTAVVKARAPT
jgi:endoglucanase